MKTITIMMIIAAITSATYPALERSGESSTAGEGDRLTLKSFASPSILLAETELSIRPSPQPSPGGRGGRKGPFDGSSLVAAQNIRFASVDLIVETKDQPLAVYQVEFSAGKNEVQIVGIEGGDHEAFRSPPHYDPLAIQQERIIVAAFSTAVAEKLPRGKVRIATIHLQITGDAQPVYHLKPSVIATVDGKPIEATVTAQTKGTPL